MNGGGTLFIYKPDAPLELAAAAKDFCRAVDSNEKTFAILYEPDGCHLALVGKRGMIRSSTSATGSWRKLA